MPTKPKMHTVQEVAELLGVTPAAIYKSIARGKITPPQFGDSYILSDDHIETLRARPKAGRPPGSARKKS